MNSRGHRPIKWHEADHPRHPAGTDRGGEFAETGSGGGWVASVVGRLTGRTEPGRPHIGRQTARRVELERLAAEPNPGIGTVMDMPGGGVHGGMANTRFQTHKDGSHTVLKTYPGDPKKALREYLVGLVGEQVDAPIPAAVQVPANPDQVVIDFIHGGKLADSSEAIRGAKPPGTPYPHTITPFTSYWRSDAGLRMGLLDALVANGDRHTNNWKVLGQPDDERGFEGFDHGEAWKQIGRARDGQVDPAPWHWGGFVADNFAEYDELTTLFSWVPNRMHPDDMALVKTRLEALKPVFYENGAKAEYLQMMERLKAITAKATGDRRIIRG